MFCYSARGSIFNEKTKLLNQYLSVVIDNLTIQGFLHGDIRVCVNPACGPVTVQLK